MDHSDENGGIDCLGHLAGQVKRFPLDMQNSDGATSKKENRNAHITSERGRPTTATAQKRIPSSASTSRRPIPLEVALQRYWPTPKIIEEVVALLPAPPVCAHRPPNARVLRHVQTPDLDLPRMGSRM